MHAKMGKLISDLLEVREQYDAKIKAKDITIGIVTANCNDRDKKIKTLERIVERVQADEVCTQKRADDNLFYFIMSATITFVLTGYFIYTL